MIDHKVGQHGHKQTSTYIYNIRLNIHLESACVYIQVRA